jgi:hypothetical protein
LADAADFVAFKNGEVVFHGCLFWQRFRVTGDGPVVQVNDGFEETHKVYLICLAFLDGAK